MEELRLHTECEKALELHASIMANMRMAASSMVEFCKELKQMRDQKRYKALDYETFEEYAEKAVGIKQRQAYTYIGIYEKLEPQLITENAQIGVTKLALLTQISSPERAEFAKENDLDALSVADIKKLIEEKNGLTEQISLLKNEKESAQEKEQSDKEELECLRDAIAEKDEMILNLKKEPVEAKATEITTDIEAIRAEAETSIRAELKKEKEDAVKKAKEDAAQKYDKEIAKAKKDAEDAARKTMEADIAEMRKAESAAYEAAQQRAEKLEKELKIAGSKESTEFFILFEQLQNTYTRMLGLLEAMDKTQSAELSKALRGAMQALGKKLEA